MKETPSVLSSHAAPRRDAITRHPPPSRQSRIRALTGAAIFAGLIASGPALADTGALSLELNGATTVDAACQVTLVARNGLDTALSDFGLDIVVFDDAGGVSDITTLNLGALPVGKTRVLRYNVADRGCDTVSALLVNGVRKCEGEGLDPAYCLSRLKTGSRVDISLGL